MADQSVSSKRPAKKATRRPSKDTKKKAPTKKKAKTAGKRARRGTSGGRK